MGRSLLAISSLLLFLLISIGISYLYIEINLPDVEALKDIHFQEPLRIYSKDGKLIEEFGSKRRIPIAISQMPKSLIDAILATEDQRFFEHPGIDLPGLVRATISVIKTGEKRQGASTITMQVVYLKLNISTQIERTKQDFRRPQLRVKDCLSDTLEYLQEELNPLYKEIADYVFETNKFSAKKIVRTIVDTVV